MRKESYKLSNGNYPQSVGENFDYFLERFYSAYDRMNEFIPHMILQGGKSLDIGTGPGNAVAASLALGANYAVGIDLNLNSHAEVADPAKFNERLNYMGLPYEKSLLIEMDAMCSRFLENTFDFITMIDVVEHIPNIQYFFKWAFDALKIGGVLFVDTLPLYYSPVGHHMWPYFTEENYPWAHLRKDFSELCKKNLPDDYSLKPFNENLNRETHQHIRDTFSQSGFDIIFEHRDYPKIHPGRYERFLKCKDELDLTGIKEEWLFEARIILVGVKR